MIFSLNVIIDVEMRGLIWQVWQVWQVLQIMLIRPVDGRLIPLERTKVMNHLAEKVSWISSLGELHGSVILI